MVNVVLFWSSATIWSYIYFPSKRTPVQESTLYKAHLISRLKNIINLCKRESFFFSYLKETLGRLQECACQIKDERLVWEELAKPLSIKGLHFEAPWLFFFNKRLQLVFNLPLKVNRKKQRVSHLLHHPLAATQTQQPPAHRSLAHPITLIYRFIDQLFYLISHSLS